MQSQDKRRISYYAALAILFGAVELFIPKVLPFFRLGFANIPILLALDFSFPCFVLLALLKAIGNSYISGNIFSFFVLISIAQSLTSAISMWILNKTKLFSNYGLSIVGASVSAITQLLVASLYIGKSVLSFLPMMLIISLASSILVAFFSYKLESLKEPPALNFDEGSKADTTIVLCLVISALASILIDSIPLALLALLIALMLQKAAKRKIMLMPHITIALFMILFGLFTPEGRVIAYLGKFKITEGALSQSMMKAIRLSLTIAISQSYCMYLEPGNNILGDTLKYATSLFASFKKESGSIEERIMKTLSLKEIEFSSKNKKAPKKSFVLSTIALLVLSTVSIIL